jgi:hypothetical protein
MLQPESLYLFSKTVQRMWKILSESAAETVSESCAKPAAAATSKRSSFVLDNDTPPCALRLFQAAAQATHIEESAEKISCLLYITQK